jgi:hypothetical protein
MGTNINLLKTVSDEASLNRVHIHTSGRNIGMITAHHHGYTASENRDRNKQLAADIRKHGNGYIKVKARYIENYGTADARPVDEDSYLVIGRRGHDSGSLKGFLIKHGKKYDQDSIMFKAHDDQSARLHGTKEGEFPGLGKEHDVGEWHPNRAGEFHFAIRNETFSFESVQFLNDKGFFNREESEF